EGRLESDDQHAFERLALKAGVRRPPNRGARNPLEGDEAGSRHRPYSMQQRENDAGRDARPHRQEYDRGQRRETQNKLAGRAAENRDDLAEKADPHRQEEERARERRQRYIRKQRRAKTSDAKDQRRRD